MIWPWICMGFIGLAFVVMVWSIFVVGGRTDQ